MQSVQYKTIGIREMFMRVDISDSGELLYRPVTPDMIYAKSPAGDPLKPNCIYEYRLRQNEQTGICFGQRMSMTSRQKEPQISSSDVRRGWEIGRGCFRNLFGWEHGWG